MHSVVIACKRATIDKKPELCKSFVEGAMEGLRYAYLDPEKAIDLHVEPRRVPGRQPGDARGADVRAGGRHLARIHPTFKKSGLGFIDPDLVAVTRQSVETYMDIKTVPPADKLYTNQFVGSVKLSDAEWTSVEQRVRSSLPAMKG